MAEIEPNLWYPGKDGRAWQEKMPAPRLAHLTPLLLDYILENKKPTLTLYDRFGRPIRTLDDRGDAEETIH